MVGGKVKTGILIAVASAAVVGLLTLGFEVRRELSALQSAPRDNIQWTLSQMEVDLLLLSGAGERALVEGDSGFDEFRRRFDLFYSRVDALREGTFVRSLDDDEQIVRELDEISDVLDDAVPVIDGSDAELRVSLPTLLPTIRTMRSPVRDLSLEGVRIFAAISDTRRQALSAVLTETAIATGGLIVALIGSVFFLFRQYRISLNKTEEAAGVNRRLRGSGGRQSTPQAND